MISVKEQIKIISKGAAEIINIEDLEMKLQRAVLENKPLEIKLGLDPSAPDIHLGHAVVLRKIKQFQELGHRAVIVIGDFTGMIGDPTGKSKTRRQLTKEEVLENAMTYERQIFKILDKDKTEVRFNSEWLSKLNFKDVLTLASKYTVARMLEREDFKNRFENHESIGIHEFFYPLMQGYDSIALKSDIELGGTDQRFNVLMGRFLQRDYEQEVQIALFMPLLEGLDGKKKMSKSLNNYIGINESPEIMFEKVMSLPDDLIIKYYELATDVHPDLVAVIKSELLENKRNPRDIKLDLALEITALYHGAEASNTAGEYFKTVFQKKEIPENIAEFRINQSQIDNLSISIIEILTQGHMAATRSEAKRLVEQGAIKINAERVLDIRKKDFNNGDVLQIGKGKFLRINIVLS